MKQGLIEFDGEVITYPNGFSIHIILDEGDHSYTFDVFNGDGDCVCESMCLIHQAHCVAMKGESNE